MKIKSTLLVALLAQVFMPVGAHVVPPHCDKPPAPLETVPPKLPAFLHNEYNGYALVEITIRKSGDVQTSRVITAKWTATGHAGKRPSGYDEVILNAVAQWKFPPQKMSCSIVRRIEIKSQ